MTREKKKPEALNPIPIRMPAETHKQLKVLAACADMKIGELIGEMVNATFYRLEKIAYDIDSPINIYSTLLRLILLSDQDKILPAEYRRGIRQLIKEKEKIDDENVWDVGSTIQREEELKSKKG